MHNRHSFLGHLAAVTATLPAVAGAAMALTSPADPDPIFAAIAEHQASIQNTDRK